MAAIPILFASFFSALFSPRVWLTLWLALLAASLVESWPYLDLLDRLLSHHPGASFLLDQTLDEDFARLHADQVPRLSASSLLSLLLITFFGGGIQRSVGTEAMVGYTEFLGDCARYFTRNLRALLLFAPALVAFSLGNGALLDWLHDDVLRNAAPWRGEPAPQWLNLELASAAIGAGLASLFYLLVFTYKVARASLVLQDRHSALFAWLNAFARVARSPLRAGLLVGSFLALQIAGQWGLGMVTARLLEVQQDLWSGFAVGQVSMMWQAVLVVAQLVAARKFLEVDAVPGQDEFEGTQPPPRK
ncbi:MAG: hypothetical protein H6836_02285 [Planctomycetes bacterium]|nr:hypothetical protein [Planctomycetota bacterium]